ncbi:hypothetical protein [Flavivirga rizhaonensis]|uniref:HNH endonuclease n=1 Tax=Flavivirga rizhaonensis TaxID=2559571 RepID=A0A4S1DZM4_9FLAO|nr:hypothetical protein [Flavivirga rizhaonensis]TGV03619.1 hypothetical protein EM932_06230 [Flavivirga rizhaonensis]
MKCIICEKDANAKGSHIVPASLIQNCIGKHYSEESYEIDSKNATVDVYYGRDNLKNTNPEIKKHHHKEDNILCQKCEDKLAELESKFSREFLQKFRIDKFKNNFESYKLATEFEILEPNKLTNLEIHAYIYSIILRFCRDTEINNGYKFLLENELLLIKEFVHGFLYEIDNDYHSVSNFKLVLVFNKYSDKGSYLCSSNEFSNPYIFFFCEVIVQLFTEEMLDKAKFLFNGCINSIREAKCKLIVGPEDFYNDLTLHMSHILGTDFATNGTKKLCGLNQKPYDENLLEITRLIKQYELNGIKDAPLKALENLTKKYSG